MDFAQIFSIIVFLLVMLLIVSEWVHRALAALLGALVLFASGILPFESSLGYIDFDTLGVLIGMMLFVAVTKASGLFEYLAIKSAKLAKGDPWLIMVALVLVTAVLSALLDNVTTVLLIGPMTFTICHRLKINPVPFFITQIIASNIGGTATLIGDPPNIMIGSQASLSFLDFVTINGPVILVILAVTLICFRFIYGRKLTAAASDRERIMSLDENEAIIDRPLLIKSVVLLGATTLAFMLHGFLHVDTAVIALGAAAVMMLLGRQDIEKVIHGVEWTTIGFFAGLFVVVGGMVETGVIDMFAKFLTEATAGQEILAILAILIASAILSAILDNIPFTATMIPVLLTMQAGGVDVTPLWWALSLGACLGGNGTLIGASANIVLSGISNREGYPLTFVSFLKVGLPLTALSVVIAGAYLVCRFVLL